MKRRIASLPRPLALLLALVLVAVSGFLGVRVFKPASAEANTDVADTGAFEPRIRGNVAKAVMSETAVVKHNLPAIQGEETATLTYAPEVPPTITRTNAAKVIVNLETREVVKELANGVRYTFWTFGGEVPGPMIRVREGDLVQLNLGNHPSSKLPHNIDLHAVTGTGGGAEATLVVPGKSATFEFRALKPGLYVYHCATAPVGLHVANGMYGLIHVQPKEGLPEVDREYYVMQSEFYTNGKFAEKGLMYFDQEKALDEEPEYVVFNGAVGSLTDANALQATVGEKVRLYVGNGGPNLNSAFHVIGEIFDHVYTEGGSQANQTNVQTTLIPAGGSTIVDFLIDVPGKFTLVDHSLFRAFNKGAVGIINAVGPENHGLYTGQIALKDYKPASPAMAARR